MKKILIYGDSNVWGDNFLTGERIPDECQWPIILGKKFKEEYMIFQEGLPGRLAGDEEEVKTFKNGKSSFMATFRTNAPLNQVIIMLGTNDLQLKYAKSAEKIIKDLEWYYQIILKLWQDEEDRKKYFVDGKMPKFLFILPIPFDYKKNAKSIFNFESEKNRNLVMQYFKENNTDFDYLILDDVPLFEDGLHLNYDGHKMVATIVEEKIKSVW